MPRGGRADEGDVSKRSKSAWIKRSARLLGPVHCLSLVLRPRRTGDILSIRCFQFRSLPRKTFPFWFLFFFHLLLSLKIPRSHNPKNVIKDQFSTNFWLSPQLVAKFFQMVHPIKVLAVFLAVLALSQAVLSISHPYFDEGKLSQYAFSGRFFFSFLRGSAKKFILRRSICSSSVPYCCRLGLVCFLFSSLSGSMSLLTCAA